MVPFINAKRKIKHADVDANIYFRDVTKLGFLSGKFDLVLDICCFHSLDHHQKQLYRKNLIRLLRPGGTFLLYSFLSEKTDGSVGISEEDIELFSNSLEKQSVERGTERELRDSIWLKFRKKP